MGLQTAGKRHADRVISPRNPGLAGLGFWGKPGITQKQRHGRVHGAVRENIWLLINGWRPARAAVDAEAAR